MSVSRENYRFFITTMVKNGYQPKEIHALLHTAWNEEGPSSATVYRVCKEIEDGRRTTLEDAERSGRPSTAVNQKNIELIAAAVKENPHLSIVEMQSITGISSGSLFTLLHRHLNLKSLCSKWIPKELTEDQKILRVQVATELLQLLDSEFPKDKIFWVDEKWFFLRALGNKNTNKVWVNSAADKPGIPRRNQGEKKFHVILAASLGGHHYFEIIPKDQSVNSEVYIAFLMNMHSCFAHSSNALGWRNGCLIHDNARPHVSRMVTDFLQKKRLKTIRQSSPLFPRLQFTGLLALQQTRNHESETKFPRFG